MTEGTVPDRRRWCCVLAIRLGSAALALCGVAALAATTVDANVASQAELEAVRGVGPGLAEAILAERRKAPFKDWPDFVARVKGVGAASAARLSAAGLTVEAGKLPATAK
ncbi:MAG: helix-hairpin-helix domain-containing protein [Burkholderiaceae bacterium]